MIVCSIVSEWTFMGELMNDRLVKEQEHLTCFMPGLLALGAWHGTRHAQVLAARPNGARHTATPAEDMLTNMVLLHQALAN
jgi:hypothetical protein